MAIARELSSNAAMSSQFVPRFQGDIRSGNIINPRGLSEQDGIDTTSKQSLQARSQY